MNQQKIYIISGLGADERVFKYIDFSGYIVIHIHWIPPLPNESIKEYAKRLSEQIKDENPILIGMSFGGIMALEIGRFLKTEKIILIASVKSSEEIPTYLKVIGKLRLHKLLPTSILKYPNFISYWFFGIEEFDDRKLFNNILNDTDPAFLKWAIDKIVNWNSTQQYPNLIHIHGSKDRVFPISLVKPNIIIEQGGHFMIVNKATKLTSILRSVLSN